MRNSSDENVQLVTPAKPIETAPKKKKVRGPKPKNWQPKQQKSKGGPAVKAERVPQLCYQQVLQTKVQHARAGLPQHTPAVAAARLCVPRESEPAARRVPKTTFLARLGKVPSRRSSYVFNLRDDGVAGVLESLMARYGRGTNSSFLDATYNVYIREDKEAAVCFKVSNGVAIMYGDPLCAADQLGCVFEAFRQFCKEHGWRMAVVGCGLPLATHARARRWKSMEVATEQVLNPQTNPILEETGGKTICRVNRKLHKEGVRLHVYDPAAGGIDAELQAQLLALYDDWRAGHAQRNRPASYSAVIDPFALPGVSRYLYTVDGAGQPNSFAGLIRLGARNGALLEPCIAAPAAPRNTTDFLATMALGLLRDEGGGYMTFGVEALPQLGAVAGLPFPGVARRLYRAAFDALALDGRRAFHEKFRPDESQRGALFMLFPPGRPRVGVARAVLDVSHVSAREVWRRARAMKKGDDAAGAAAT